MITHLFSYTSSPKKIRTGLLRFLAMLLVFAALCGCSSDSGDQLILKYNVDAPAVTLDPQLAFDNTSVTLIENCFEGLLRIDSNGDISPAAAESYTVSNNGLIYTFTLKDNLTWNDGETPLTVYDFEFAFERLLSPETNSPHADNYLCIKNAEKCLNGESPVTALGVTATQNTITFVLEYANPYFTYLLASTSAMPCNRTFFEQTRGKYGKNLTNTLFNGPFEPRTYKENRYYLLRQNTHYHTPVPAFGINIYITDKTTVERLQSKNADIAKISNSDIALLDTDRFTIHRFEDTSWVVAFNTAAYPMNSYYLRMALALSLETENIDGFLKSANYRPAAALIPGATEVFDENYRQLAGEKLTLKKDVFAAKEYLNLAYDELVSGLPKLTLLCPDNDEMALLCGKLQSDWQQNIALFVNVERVAREELDSRIASGNYQLALIPVTASYNNPAAFLGEFLSAENICRYGAGDGYAQTFAEALLQPDPADTAALYRRLETELIENAVLIPMFYETSAYAVSSDLTGLGYRAFSDTLYFGYAQTTETDK